MKLTASIFLGVYLLALLAPVGTLVSFKINQEEIAAEFCENKDKPELNCEGKCHLSKLLAEQEQQDSEESTLNSEIDYPVGKISTIETSGLSFLDKKLAFNFYKTPMQKEFLIKIDHPPQV